MTGELDKLEDKLASAEKLGAVMENNIQTIFLRIGEIRAQLGDFIARSELVITCRQEINAIAADVKSLTDWRSDHIQSYSTLITEHRLYCQKHDKSETWWQQRLGRVMDWAVPAIIAYLLFLYKSGGKP